MKRKHANDRKPAAESKRATVSFTDKDIKRLEKLRDSLDLMSMSQTISAAIKIADEIRARKAEGLLVILKNERDNTEREVVIPGFDPDGTDSEGQDSDS